VDGWFCTGDVATIDPEGYMRIVDRTKDMVKSGGEWISTVDLENALMAHEDVLEAAVIAVSHPKWQERPLALVVLNPNSENPPSNESLVELLLRTFEKWQLPDDYIFVEEIPKTSVGKFDKKVLRAQYQDYQIPR
jgi:fatty-acyl-CoA synthase